MSSSAPEGSVLVTGSAGRIGSMLVPGLAASGWRLRLIDRVADDRASGSIIVTGDLRDPAVLARAVDAGPDGAVGAIVHLAALADEGPWERIRDDNIDLTYRVFEAARAAGVRRVVYASSIHAVGFAPYTHEAPADLAAQPDTLYGVSKVFGEALGRYYVDRYGMQVICARIGTCADRPSDLRSLETWLSPGDCVRLFDSALRTTSPGFHIVWGVSNNKGRFFSHAAGQAIGYQPNDDAHEAADSIVTPWWGNEPHESDRYLGGGFTTPGFGIDEVRNRFRA